MTDQEARAELVGIPCGQGTPHEPHEWQMSATGYCRCPGAADQEARDERAHPVDVMAQDIRRVDGAHSLGAGALAQALYDLGYRQHPEPEWEYGLYEEDPHRERDRPHRAYNGAHLVSDNRAHVETQWRRGHPSIQFVRRRKAGPWEPVPEEGSPDVPA